MHRILTAIVLMLSPLAANAAPSATQIGTDKTSNPYPVSILYNGTWYPMGVINTTSGYFLTQVQNGGTGISSGTSGGIPYFSATNMMASSTALTQYGIVYGGGAGLAPSSTAAGTSNYLLKGNGASAPTFASLSSIIDSALTASTQGSILYRGASDWTALAPGTSGQFLKSQGSGANPVWAASSSATAYGPEIDAVAACSVDNTGTADVTTALNTCLSTNTSVMLRTGTYKVSSCINVPTQGRLVGAGMSATTITSTSATADVVCPVGARVTLENFGVTKSVTATAGAGVYVPNISQSYFKNIFVQNNYYGFNLSETDFSTCEFCVAQNNYSHGFYLPSTSSATSPLQWNFISTLSQFNNGWGYYINGISANTILGSLWENPISFANLSGGFAYTGGGTINDIEVHNGTGSGDCGDEVYLNLGGGWGNQFIGGLYEYAGLVACGRNQSTAASNTGNGFSIAGLKNVTIVGTNIWSNSYSGILVTATSGTAAINGNLISDNGIYRTSSAKSGVFLSPSSGLFTGVISANDFATPTGSSAQTYGIVVGSFAKSTIIGNNASVCLIVGTTIPTGTAAAFNYGTNCP